MIRSIINREQDYAIRMAAYLSQRGEEPLSIKQLAKRLCIPPSAASKIAHRLTERGVLSSVRGRHGGVCLRDDLVATLSLLDVLEAMGLELRMNECTGSANTCPWGEQCSVHRFLLGEQEALLERFATKKISSFPFPDSGC